MAQLWHVVAMLHRSERCGTDMGITSFVNTKQIQHTSGGKPSAFGWGKKRAQATARPAACAAARFKSQDWSRILFSHWKVLSMRCRRVSIASAKEAGRVSSSGVKERLLTTSVRKSAGNQARVTAK